MLVYIGADHRGFEMKKTVTAIIRGLGYEVVDVGNSVLDPEDDYPDFAAKVGEKMQTEYLQARAVLICGSGVGMSVAVNKFPNVRAGLISSPDQAFDARRADDINTLCLSADHLDKDKLKPVILAFFETPYEPAEKYARRLKKIEALETHKEV